MKKTTYLFAAAMALTLSGCIKDHDLENTGNKNVAGYIYTTTNGQSTNQVVRFDRLTDGSLGKETVYSTESKGGANPAVGGDAHGDFDSQGAVKIIGNYLLAVNAGGNTVSVFSLNRTNGHLNLMQNHLSGGTRPIGIAATPVKGSATDFWLVVGNQWNNPNVQKDLPNVERYPNDAFHMMDLTKPHPTDQERNIQLFRFDSSNGNLTPISKLDTYVRENGGPACVAFSHDGSKLAVATWGIAHFGTVSPSLEELHESRVYIYDFNNGTISNKRFFEEEGIAGTIGIDWAPKNNKLLYASNFNTTVAKTNNSLTVLADNGAVVTKAANFTTGKEDDLDEACWTVINPAGDRLYVSSFSGNLITPFKLDGLGNVTGKLPFEKRGDFAPPGDTKDMYITSDSRYLYNIGAFQSFSMNIFDITADGGVKYRNQRAVAITISSTGQTGVYNFLGLAGFDL